MVNEVELKNLIQKNANSHIYFLFGDDPYLVKTYTDKIVDFVVGDNADLDLTSLDYNAKVAEISDATMQFSFLGGRKCVKVSNLDFEELSASEYKEFKNMLENASLSNCLVLYFDSFVIDTKRSKRFKEIESIISNQNGVVAELNHRTEVQLVKILCEGARKRGLKLAENTARFLINYVSSDLNILVNELNKLCLYKKTGEITVNDVEELCARSLEASIYDISNHILNKQIDKAIYEVNVLVNQKIAPAVIYSDITSAFADIYYALTIIEAGVLLDNAVNELNYPKHIAFRLKNAISKARSLGESKVRKVLDILLSSDTEIKASIDAFALEKMIFMIYAVL